MAEANVPVSQDQLSCPICLDLLKNPVAIPCGHSFCMECITSCWNEEDSLSVDLTVHLLLRMHTTVTLAVLLVTSLSHKTQVATPTEVTLHEKRKRYLLPGKCVYLVRSLCSITMAEANVPVSQDQLSCPICLDLLKNPVAIPCGHSFCMECITSCWNEEDAKGVYSCPQCRETFTPRPVLSKNIMLANMVEMLKNVGIPSDSPTLTYAEPGDVECGVCSGRKQKAVKSCLVCLSSYCETHFKAHNDLFPGSTHKAVEADGKLEDLLCSRHGKLLEVFCRTDQTCICVLCVTDEHSGHKTVSVTAERAEKEQSAQAAVVKTEESFDDMICSMKRKCSEVTKLIRDEEEADVTQAEEYIETLEQEISKLQKADAKLEQLSKTNDNASFLQSFQSLQCSLMDQEKSSDLEVCHDLSFEKVTRSVSQLKDKLEDFLTQETCSITETAKQICRFLPQNPLTRRDFLKYSCQLSLDPTTAQGEHYVFKGNKTVSWMENTMWNRHSPERFDYFCKVLCKESVSGRCYWEVERSTSKRSRHRKHVTVAVAYKQRTHKAYIDDPYLGDSQHSWALSCPYSPCCFMHNGVVTKLNITASSRVGVYVDHKAGILSFYSIYGDTMTLLHKIQTTFTQPLYPCFRIVGKVQLNLCQ
ncbi:E3 ubiquitin-protein ligase TRIM47-like isoform X2 [Engraulis encrasicolus]|uniref:E3 ubiquitin-protein ligase TRIM47-like isoform X2 n=1 Tax=Engraulis encrasicolus TaxID=184585 RepID=UPI002FD6F4AE